MHLKSGRLVKLEGEGHRYGVGFIMVKLTNTTYEYVVDDEAEWIVI